MIQKSSIQFSQTNKKVFDAIVCDETEEIKVIAFNGQVDRLYELMIFNNLGWMNTRKTSVMDDVQNASNITNKLYFLLQ